MTTRAPTIVLAVPPGAIRMTRQPDATRRETSFCPSACRMPLYRPSETITSGRRCRRGGRLGGRRGRAWLEGAGAFGVMAAAAAAVAELAS
jgi:hypothetical protein